MALRPGAQLCRNVPLLTEGSLFDIFLAINGEDSDGETMR